MRAHTVTTGFGGKGLRSDEDGRGHPSPLEGWDSYIYGVILHFFIYLGFVLHYILIWVTGLIYFIFDPIILGSGLIFKYV